MDVQSLNPWEKALLISIAMLLGGLIALRLLVWAGEDPLDSSVHGDPIDDFASEDPLLMALHDSSESLENGSAAMVMLYLGSPIDADIECPGTCTVRASWHGGNMTEGFQSSLDWEPSSLREVNRLTLSLEEGSISVEGSLVQPIIPAGSVEALTVKHSKPLCPDPRYEGIIDEAAQRYGIPRELIMAIIMAESSWDPYGHRYEPLFQLADDEGLVDDPAWCYSGLSIGDWLMSNPERAAELQGLTEEQLDTHAQTRIYASYGLMQILYTSAYHACGYSGDPEGLYDVRTNILCGSRALADNIDRYEGDLSYAVSAYNAGQPAWPVNSHNMGYTERVLSYYTGFLQCQNA